MKHHARAVTAWATGMIAMTNRLWQLLALAACCAPAFGASAPPAVEQQRIQRNYFGLHIFYPEALKQWPNIGFGSWRLWDIKGITWADINPAQDTWRFDALDRVVALAEQHQVQMVLTLGQTPTWASSEPARPAPRGPGAASVPADIKAWERYVLAVVQRYKGRIQAYEIWNEPRIDGIDKQRDGQFFYGNAAALAELTKSAYAIVKRVDPAATVLSPAFDGAEMGERRLAAFLQAGGDCCFDVLSVHLYPSSPFEPESLFPRVQRLRAVMDRAGLRRPIWNTEFGYLHQESGNANKTTPDGFQSAALSASQAPGFLARSMIVGAAAGLTRFYWFAWDSSSMGLLSALPNRVPTATAAAYRTVADWLVGGRVDRCMQSGPHWECTYQGPLACDGRLLWTTAGMWKVEQTAPFDQVRQLDGTAGRLQAGERISIGADPVLLYSSTALSNCPAGRSDLQLIQRNP